MAKKYVTIPEEIKDCIMLHIGSRFEKNAILPSNYAGFYYISKNGACKKLYTFEKYKRINKKTTKCFEYGFFDKWVDADIYLFRNYVSVSYDSSITFTIKDKDIGDTHAVKVYNDRYFNVYINNETQFVSKYLWGEKRECVTTKEVKEMFFAAAQKATEEVFGKLPWNQYIIDYEKENMTKEQQDRATAWLKIINKELEPTGLYFKHGWKR
ncbi:MAG: hypothetical protein IJA97_03695 [Clostridia bacterium]|nr:hypothetical protein [Clostridia bacterium]